MGAIDRSRWARAIAIVGVLMLPSGSARVALADAGTSGSVLRVPQDYATIQQAVNAALSGDVIVVGSGTYAERVTIVKSGIRLESETLNAAVLDGASLGDGGPAISLVGTTTSRVRNVSIVGFSIQNYLGTLGAGISLTFADQAEIRANRVSNTGAQSIALAQARFNTIAGNTLSNGTFGVGMSMRSSDNIVNENTIFGTFTHGVRVSMTILNTPVRNTIEENLICVQDAASQFGILITNVASGNIVKENRIVGNGRSTAGIRLDSGTSSNLVRDNLLDDHSIEIDDQGTGNTVVGNGGESHLKCP